MIVLTFGDTRVEIDDAAHFLRTVYPDGSEVPACPHDTDAYRQTARRLGYGEDTWACCWQHEVFHTLLAWELTGTVSPTLWAVAHGFAEGTASLAAQHQEEAVVLAFQGLVNGVEDTEGVLAAFLEELTACAC